MSVIKVKPLELFTCSEQIDGLSSLLNRYATDVDQISNSLKSLKTSSTDEILKSINDIENKMSHNIALLKELSYALFRIASYYEKTEQELMLVFLDEHLTFTNVGGVPIFEDGDNKGYGGDQGDLANKHNGIKFPWGWVWFEDKDVYNYVKTHEGFENYSESQIHDLLNQMNKEGCGYIGIVNAIFAEYEGTAEEFEQLFGFPMYDKDGNYNYDYMFIDLYCSTDNKYYLNESNGVTALSIETLCSYEKRPDVFLDEYGVELGYYNDDGEFQYSDEAKLAVINDINSKYSNTDVVSSDITRDGLTVSAQENHIIAYLHEKGITSNNITYDVSNTMDATTIKNNLEDDRIVQVLLLSGTKMYRDAGGTNTLSGGHYVTITGVADDGRYIVSSYGNKYYIDPSQAKVASYQTINLELGA